MDKDLKKIIDETLQEYFGSDPSMIGIDSGEKKYSKQEPGGQMAAVNCNETTFRVYNETLCPELWDEQLHLNPEVRLNLLRMAQDFYEKTKFTAPILDVYLMGSIANYNWTPDSDADVHVIIDFTQLQMPNETASKVAKSAGAQWNLEHNATVKEHKVEINIQSVKAEKPHVTGIYSLMKDGWVRKPVRMNVQVNKPLIQVQYSEIKKFVEAAIQSGDRERMKTAKDYLDDYRQHGLDTAGELSTQNIVYKVLRAKGLVKNLKDAIISAYDKEMSVDETWTDINAIPMPQMEGNETPRLTLLPNQPDISKGAIKIMLGDVWFANTYRNIQGDGKWVFNRHTGAFNMGVPDWHKSYDSPEDLVHDLQRWVDDKTTPVVDESANIPTQPAQSDYIGSIVDGEVRGERIPVGHSRNYIHNDFPGLISGMNSTNWRFQTSRNLILWNTQPTEESMEAVEHYLSKRGITNAKHKNMYSYTGDYDGVREVTQRDVGEKFPLPNGFKGGEPDLSMLTLDNLKSLRAKSARMVKAFARHEDKSHVKQLLQQYKFYDEEIKQRLGQINEPVAEMATMSLQGKQAFADNSPLKNATVEEVAGNVVMFRMDKGGFFAPGYTLVYFMDTSESAQLMKDGKLPYLMVPRGTFHSGGNPITDIWKKKFQKPGTEHILGVIEGNSNEQEIFIDMITVRPGWQRNSIARKMLETVKKHYPEAKITTSSQTDKGKKFFKAVSEGHNFDYNATYDFVGRRDNQMCEIATFLRNTPGDSPVPWKTIPATLLKKTWLIFGKYNRINDNDIDKIADQILTNIVRLYVSNEFTGHSTNHHMREEVADNCGIEFTEEEWDKNSWRFENISDYGMEPLEKIYGQIFNAETPEEKLYACDKALNVVHQRSDLADIFVEGGTSTLTKIALQGGYNAGYEYGEVNKMTRDMKEGYGAGIPSQDRLHIPSHRWQIRSKDAPKTPKMKEDFTPRYTDSPTPSITPRVDKRRIDFYSEDPHSVPSKAGKEIKGIINDAEKRLDWLFERGAKYVTLKYMVELFDELYDIYVPLPKTSKVYPQMCSAVIAWLSRDYDIRDNDKRIGERLNESEQKIVNDIVDQLIAVML